MNGDSNFSLFSSSRALNLGILRDPGSEVEDRQYQVDLQSINIGTAQWEQLKPEKEGIKGGALVESERSSQNPALEWNMASRSGATWMLMTVCCGEYNEWFLFVRVCVLQVFTYAPITFLWCFFSWLVTPNVLLTATTRKLHVRSQIYL